MKNEQPPERERVTICRPKDFDVHYICGSGAGGQARNKVHSGVQIIHRESGAMGQATDSRSQYDNKRQALLRLTKTPQFKFWLARTLYELEMGEKLEQTIERETTDQNLRYEIKDEKGRWIEVTADYFDSAAARSGQD